MKPAQLKLKARDVMNPRVTAATRRPAGRDLALQLMSGAYSGVPVVEREGEVIGVVTELDLLKAVLEGKDLRSTTAEDIMGLPALSFTGLDSPVGATDFPVRLRCFHAVALLYDLPAIFCFLRREWGQARHAIPRGEWA